MPVADTELLFLMNPRDPRHERALDLIKRLKGELYVPDVAVLEFEVTLRSRGRSIDQVRRALTSLRKIFASYDVREVSVLCTDVLIMHLDIMKHYGLSFFDSMVAASAKVLDGVVVSDDDAFDRVEGLRRIPIAGHSKR